VKGFIKVGEGIQRRSGSHRGGTGGGGVKASMERGNHSRRRLGEKAGGLLEPHEGHGIRGDWGGGGGRRRDKNSKFLGFSYKRAEESQATNE